MTARRLSVYSALLLFANAAYADGTYQRTKDGQALVWNNYPRRGDQATWSGKRDPEGYAVGHGTLTWYRVEQKNVTGSNIPSAKRIAASRYSGKMVRGKLDGPVINVDANGKTFRGTFVSGRKAGDWGTGPPAPNQRANKSVQESADIEAPAQGPSPVPDQQANKRVQESADIEAPTEGPSPVPDQPTNKRVQESVDVEAPTEGPSPADQRATKRVSKVPTQSVTPSSSPGIPVVAEASPQVSVHSARSSPPSSSAAVDPAVKNRIIADFKEQTQSVLSRVADATGNFHEIDRIDSVKQLPASVSESVRSLVDRARDFRAKLGYETALHECRTETQTIDALSAVDQITRNIAANDAAEAGSRLAVFLTSNSEPIDDSQKALWRYLTSMQLVCSRSEKDAEIHLQRAQSLASAGRTSDAIREYQEAYRAFPNPATAEKIHLLQISSLGL